MTRFLSFSQFHRALVLWCVWGATFAFPLRAQEAKAGPAATDETKSKIVPSKDFPAQIELLETQYRFETNGDSRKEVHALVKINSELGARQFARLNFDYNRAFQQLEIPFARITHPSGGTVDMLPSAVTDTPNPAIVDFPAYHDVRVKSARILGLAPGDMLEYRVVTTTTHHPLAPDFWLAHEFSVGGVVSDERFTIDLPSACKVLLHASPSMPAPVSVEQGPRKVLRWQRSPGQRPGTVEAAERVVLSTFASWSALSSRLASRFLPAENASIPVLPMPDELAHTAGHERDRLRAQFDFVSARIKTVDLPLGTCGFKMRSAAEILRSGYASPEEKIFLMKTFLIDLGISASPVLTNSRVPLEYDVPVPSAFSSILLRTEWNGETFWLDPSMEVAPFGVIPADLRGKPGLMLSSSPDVLVRPQTLWPDISEDLPFPSTQKVAVDASLAADGKLTAKVKYTMRGDNELLLRVAFHQSPKDKWKEVAQLLALSDGFRGQITNVTASDPYATKEPFTAEYEITQPKFVDWSRKPARIPVLLPQISLPDLPAKPAAGAPPPNIELGTPLEVDTQVTLRLPAGTTATAPTGTSVSRDYATFTSKYSVQGSAITASRKINFLLRELPAARAADYNAFLHAVQSDQSQLFTALLSGNTPPDERKPK